MTSLYSDIHPGECFQYMIRSKYCIYIIYNPEIITFKVFEHFIHLKYA